MRDVFKPWTGVAMSATLVLAACKSAPTHVYSLTTIEPAARLSASSSVLRIDAVHVPPNWDRIEIMSPRVAGDLKINDLDRWAAPLAAATRQVLSADLDARLPPGAVIYPHLAKSAGALGISVEILEFTFAGTHGSMQASWVISPAQSPDSARRNFATVDTAIPDTQPAAIAHAWSVLIAEISDRIAADVAAFPVL